VALSSPASMAGRAGDRSFPCPCCGYLVFGDLPGSYEICPICFWEDDALQLEFATTLAGGANRPTLQAAQVNFARSGAADSHSARGVRRVRPDDVRDPLWRPVDPVGDTFEVFGDPGCRRAPECDETLYYWRSTFWRLRTRTPRPE